MQRILSMRQVCETTSLSRAAIYRKLDQDDPLYYDPTFPTPAPLSDRRMHEQGEFKGQLQKWNRLGFLEHEIDQWIAERFKKRAP